MLFSVLVKLSRIGAALAFSATWTVLEYLKAESFLRYGFGGLAYALAETPVCIQIAELTGAYGVTFLVASVNAAIWLAADEVLSRYRVGRITSHGGAIIPRARGELWYSLSVLACTVATLAFGSLRLSSGLDSLGLRVMLAQYDHPASRSYELKEKEWLDEYRLLSSAKAQVPIDLVIFPENAILRPLSLDPLDRREGDAIVLNYLSRVARENARSILFGSLERSSDSEGGRLHNSAFLFDSNGDLAGRYRKRLLAPFGEADPLGGLIPALDEAILGMTDAIRLSPGKHANLMTVSDSLGAQHQFGVLICYESTSGSLARDYAALGAEYLVVITSDRWTDSPRALRQHAAFSIFRAVENRRSVVRVGNGGLSCGIDPLGRIVAELPIFCTAAATWEPYAPISQSTFYSRTGDWILALAVAALIAGLAISFIPAFTAGRRKKASIESRVISEER